MSDTALTHVKNLLATSSKVVFITGAGISAESGLPTYRGIGGLYDGKLTSEGIPIEQALSAMTFEINPELSWKYLWQVGKACAEARPNRAHELIAEFEHTKKEVLVLTQNVDGLHRAAGSKNLIEIHGHAFDLFCTACGERYNASLLLDAFSGEPQLPPLCEKCEGVIRPDVVLFGEMLPYDAISAFDYIRSSPPDMILCVGTSALLPYIVEPVYGAKSNDTVTVEINPKETDISAHFDFTIRKKAVPALEALLAKM